MGRLSPQAKAGPPARRSRAVARAQRELN